MRFTANPRLFVFCLLLTSITVALGQTKFVGIREVGPRERGFYHTGEAVRFEVAGLGVDSINYEAKAVYSTEWERLPVRKGAIPVRNGEATLPLAGWPKMMWEVRVWSGEFDRVARFALIEKPRPKRTMADSEKHPVAVWLASAKYGEAPVMDLLGMRSLHIDIPTHRIAPGPDQPLTFPEDYDGFVKDAIAHNISVTLKYSHFAGWLSGHPEEARRWYAPTDYVQWRRIVKGITEHYKELGVHSWILSNEPDGGGFFHGGPPVYIKFVKETVPVIKSVDADTIIVGPEVYAGDTSFMIEVLNECAADFDVMSLHKPQHLYGAPLVDYMRLRDIYMRGKPMWSTEAPGLARTMIREIGHGIDKFFLFAMNWPRGRLFDRLGRLNEAGIEWRAVSDFLEDTTLVSSPSNVGEDLELYFFKKKTGEVFLVCWRNTIPEHGYADRVYIKAERPVHAVADRFGNLSEIEAKDGRIRFTVRSEIQYIFGFTKVPSVARDPIKDSEFVPIDLRPLCK